MPVEYADIILAVAALFAAILYLRTRRRHRRKKGAPPVRPASPTSQTARGASKWAPPRPRGPPPPGPPDVWLPPPRRAKLGPARSLAGETFGSHFAFVGRACL